ncbi:MAG: 2-oxo acid dehydrogenase subunit E2, partial [Saezia sp.]
KVKIGDKVNMGDVIAIVKSDGSVSAPAPSAASVAPVAEKPSASVPAATSQAPQTVQQMPAHEPAAKSLGSLPYASPSIRKLAREFGVPVEEVKGTGERGRITAQDVRQFVAQVMSGAVATKAQAKSPTAGSGVGMDLLPWPKVDFTQFGEVESKPLSRIKKISGANLHRNWVMIPHVTNNEDADITELEALRVQLNQEAAKAKSDVKFTLLAFLIKACVAALKKFPEFNASLQGDELVYKKYYNIGFAADTPNGLVVPVLKDADKKSVSEIAQETAELASKARAGKMGPADMSGGCFTISSLGGFGGTYFTPIINAPEVAILGVCKSSMKPVWDGEAFQPRLMLPLSLSYDHRVIDGALAARFNAYLAAVLADFRRVLI